MFLIIATFFFFCYFTVTEINHLPFNPAKEGKGEGRRGVGIGDRMERGETGGEREGKVWGMGDGMEGGETG